MAYRCPVIPGRREAANPESILRSRDYGFRLSLRSAGMPVVEVLMPETKSKSGTPLGPIGTNVLFENEHIRVWSVELPGKGHQPLHEHEHPYLIVPVSEGKALMRWEDGRERKIVDVLGNVVYREASGGPHELFNLEDTKFHSILVEIKAAGASG